MPKVKEMCSFCLRTKDQVDVLIEGAKVAKKAPVYICEHCATVAFKAVKAPQKVVKKPAAKKTTVKTPQQIKAILDQYIIGQDHAKQILSVAVYNHYKRIANPVIDDVEIEKSNILLMGPSGCGKTLLVSTIAKTMDIPFVIADSTSITESGYHGNDVDMIFELLYKNAKYDLDKAQKGIVFIDEMDKKSNKGNSLNVKDVSGEGVQMSLLRLVEGDTVKIMSGKRGEDQVSFDTKNVMFIVGGAFVGIEKIIEKRLQKGATVGFGADLKDMKSAEYIDQTLDAIEPDDIHEYGFLREFVGRFPIIIPLHSLSCDDLVKVLTEPKNSLVSQYAAMFKVDGVKLEFSQEFLKRIAKVSHDRKTGARGLRSMFEKTLSDIQFRLPSLKKEGVKTVYVEEDGSISTIM
jgi:ATP-dependent Clp protease ATP-binding subunit ClpX